VTSNDKRPLKVPGDVPSIRIAGSVGCFTEETTAFREKFHFSVLKAVFRSQQPDWGKPDGEANRSLSLLEQSTEKLPARTGLVGSVAEGYLLAGRLELAAQFAEQTLEWSRRHHGRSGEALAVRLLGDIAATHNPPEVEKAKVHYSQSINIAAELGMRPLLAHCNVGLGKLYRRSGDLRLAKEHLHKGIAMMREMEMGLWLERAESE
jgi:hypothetical protein